MPDFKDETPRRKAAQIKKMAKQVEGGEDIVAIASGAKNLITTDDAINNYEIAKLFAAPKRGRGRPTKYDPTWMHETMINIGRMGGSKEKIALYLGINKDTLNEWSKSNQEFSAALEEAMLLSQVWWENFGQAATLGMVEGWSANNWQFFMKTRFGESYREVRVTELNTNQPLIDARTVVINARELSPEYRESLKMALLAAKKLTEGDADE